MVAFRRDDISLNHKDTKGTKIFLPPSRASGIIGLAVGLVIGGFIGGVSLQQDVAVVSSLRLGRPDRSPLRVRLLRFGVPGRIACARNPKQ